MAHSVEIRFKTVAGATGVEGIENDDESIIRSKPLTMPQGGGCNQLRIAVWSPGRVWWKSVIGVANAQTASSSRPSITGAVSTRTASTDFPGTPELFCAKARVDIQTSRIATGNLVKAQNKHRGCIEEILLIRNGSA